MAVLGLAVAGCPPLYGPGANAAGASQPAPATQAAVGEEPELDAPLKVPGQPERSPTPSEMASAAQEMTARMGRMLERVERRHAKAKAASDKLRSDCVAEKLIQVRALLTAASEARARLERAVEKNQLATAQEEYSGVGVTFLKAKLLGGEARQCMVDPPRIGHTETRVTVEPLQKGDRGATEPSPPAPTPR